MSDAGLQHRGTFFLYYTPFDMITEGTIKMQIQYIIENDLFFKGLFFLKRWAGRSCRLYSSCQARHGGNEILAKCRKKMSMTVRDEQMPPFISSAVDGEARRAPRYSTKRLMK